MSEPVHREFTATLREAIAGLAAADPELARFGAARHRYALAPVIEPSVAAAWPDELREFATAVAGGGAGPYYGVLALDRTQPIAAPAGVSAWQTALPVSHLGCGYAALVALDGPARGEVWLDARALGIVTAIHPSFTAYYLDWIDRVASGRWLLGLVPPGQCALASALSGFLGIHERQLGIPEGSLAGAELAAALGMLGPGSIAIAAESPLPLFVAGDPVDPCVTCARLVDNLAAQGLRRDVLVPGVVPITEAT